MVPTLPREVQNRSPKAQGEKKRGWEKKVIASSLYKFPGCEMMWLDR